MSWTPDLPADRESNPKQIDEKGDRSCDNTGRAGSTKTKYKNSIDASIEHNTSVTHLVNKTVTQTGQDRNRSTPTIPQESY